MDSHAHIAYKDKQVIWISTADILNCIDYEFGMIEDEYPKLDISILDKAVTSTEKQRRIAPIKPTNAFVKRKPCRNLHLYRR